MSVQPLFTPVRMGDLDLPNRIVMAPLTRMRAGPIDHVPTALQAESVFVSSGGELPRNFVDGPIIWKGV
jgi:2,4-dienoyl-CoA reductase-like NADH-dependent reductase (Old Yellow Enzyme family)